jgi:type II secretory ATPase GspE/PulE/Tfp pilus assembly ATPase PilB-like protein
MKEKRPTPDPSRRESLAKLRRESVARLKELGIYDNLQHWVNRTILAAFRLKAKEIHYIRAKDGLTVQFRRGADVLKAMGPYKRYQDRLIPRLEKMGQRHQSKRYKGQTGGFGALVDNYEVRMPIFYSRTKSGERMVVRLASSKPYKPQ